MSMKEISSLIEQFESEFDTYLQSLKKSNDEIYSQLSTTWKNIQALQKEKEELDLKVGEQNSELTGLRTQSEEYDKKIEELKAKKEEILSKISELKGTLEQTTDELKKPQLELEDLNSKLNSVNEKIESKESEKGKLEQQKIENDNKESQLKGDYSKKMEELESTLKSSKQQNFFASFLIDHSEEDIHEVDILSTILEQGKCNLSELKTQLDIPPIMAVRTIKQLAVKGIINLDESTEEITMP